MNRLRKRLVVGLAAVALVAACAGVVGRPNGTSGAASTLESELTPVVFVSGVTGTQLRDGSDGARIWGGSRQLFAPRDGGYRLALPLAMSAQAGQEHRQATYDAVGPILEMRILGWTKTIYRPLLEAFEDFGYRRGDLTTPAAGQTFFFYDYDWRYGNLESVRRLDELLAGLSGGANREVDLVCQSNAAKICRWLAKYGALDAEQAASGASNERRYQIRKLVLVGVSNSGALRVLQLLNRGRSYLPLLGRRFHPETFFSLRPLFEDLPAARADLFFDETGRLLDVDLFDVDNWQRYGWSVFDAAVERRLSRRNRVDLFGDRQARVDYLAAQLAQARRLQTLLARDPAEVPPTRYYLLQNSSAPTIDRALLRSEGDSWGTYFLGDKAINRRPELADLASAPGDGHAVLASQRGLSPGELAALVETAEVGGGHFEAVVEPAGLAAILGFLADEDGEPAG